MSSKEVRHVIDELDSIVTSMLARLLVEGKLVEEVPPCCQETRPSWFGRH